jgi:hypothetical protein
MKIPDIRSMRKREAVFILPDLKISELQLRCPELIGERVLNGKNKLTPELSFKQSKHNI